ncbi:MAG: cyclase family protein [Rhodospirillales bacterium]|nr:cyclase family protein [Rhodospirillales bacterium]
MRKKCIDLTLPLDGNYVPYSCGEYQDPALLITPWCNVKDQGYCVSKLTFGTQTGTHIDAPSHFVSDAATLEQLPIENLVGTYHLIDLDEDEKGIYNNGAYEHGIVFLRTKTGKSVITENVLSALIRLNCRVWALAGDVEVLGKDPLYFHRTIAEAGIYLVENLNQEVCEAITPDDYFIALPLNLYGVSGSPCRVLILQDF